MKKLSFLTIATAMLLGWSSMQAQVTQDFDSMWNGSEATLDLPQGWRVDRNLTAARTVGTYASAATSVMYTGGTSLASNAKNGTWNFQSSSTPSDCSVGGLSTTVDGGTRCINLMTSSTTPSTSSRAPTSSCASATKSRSNIWDDSSHSVASSSTRTRRNASP